MKPSSRKEANNNIHDTSSIPCKQEADWDDTERAAFDPTDLPLIEYIFRQLTQFLLFVYNLDVFAVYKGTHASASRARYRRYLVPELRINYDPWDEWRYCWKILYWWIYVVYAIRVVCICTIQVILHMATLESEARARDNLRAYLTQQHPWVQPAAESAAVRFLHDYHLLEIFNNALYDYPGISLFIIMSLFVSSSYTMYYMPFRYYRKPFDAPLVRFVIEPEREIKRIDLLIGEKMAEMASVLGHGHQVTQLMYPPHSASHHSIEPKNNTLFPGYNLREYLPPDTHQVASLTKLEDAREKTRDEIRREMVDPILRPCRYSLAYYREAHRLTRNVSYVVIVLALGFVNLIQYEVINSVWDIKCRRVLHLQQTNRSTKDNSSGSSNSNSRCPLFQALSWPDTCSLVELTVLMFGLGTIVTLQIIETFVHASSQLTLIKEIRYYLEDLLNALRIINESVRQQLLRERKCASAISRRSFRLGGCTTSTNWPPDRLHLQATSAGYTECRYLNDALLKTLVKTKVSFGDLAQFSGNMSDQVSSILVLFGSVLLLTLTAGRIGGHDIERMRANVILTVWVSSNVLLVLCAYMFTKLIRIEQVVGSLIAQLVTLRAHQRARGEFDPELECLIKSWECLAHKQSASERRNSVHPFGVSLTYRTILRMNFTVLTIAALLRE